MIDALEISIPASIQPIPEVFLRLRLKEKPAKGEPYAFQLDCREEFGFFLFYGHRHSIKEQHRHFRVRFVETRQLPADYIFLSIGKLFPLTKSDIERLRIARIDFAADVSVPVDWFRRHFRIGGKQNLTEYLSIHTTAETTSLVFGSRPDRYSVYDKIHELRSRGKEVLQTGVEFGGTPKTVTRVERQCSGSRVPTQLNTVIDLFRNVAEFDPFEDVVLMESAAPLNSEDWTAQKWLMALGVRGAIKEYGWEGARKEAYRRTKRNNILGRYMQLACPRGPCLTREHLTRAYRNTTLYQLNIKKDGVYPQGGCSMPL